MRGSLAAVAAVGVLVLALAPAQAGAEDKFVRGRATADATSFSFAVAQGGAAIGLAWGESKASYKEGYSAASANPLDLSLMSMLFGSLSCPNSTVPPILDPAALPPTFTQNSLQANVGVPVEGDAQFPGFFGTPSPGPAGSGRAIATKEPGGHAEVTTPGFDLWLIHLKNPSNKAEVHLRNNVRYATATSKAESLSFFGGVVTIDNPTWTATARSGAQTSTEGSFTITGGTLFGFPRTAAESMEDLKGMGALLEALFGFVGMRLDVPTVEIVEGRVFVSPMKLGLVNMPLGRDYLTPLFDQKPDDGPSITQQITEALEKFAAESCENKQLRQILELLLGVLKGQGGIELPVGGVTVETSDKETPQESLGFNLESADDSSFDDSSFSGGSSGDTSGYADVAGTSSSAGYYDDSTVDETTEEPTAEAEAAPEEVEFAASTANRTKLVAGEKGGAGVFIGLSLILLAGGAFAAERIMRTRRLRVGP